MGGGSMAVWKKHSYDLVMGVIAAVSNGHLLLKHPWQHGWALWLWGLPWGQATTKDLGSHWYRARSFLCISISNYVSIPLEMRNVKLRGHSVRKLCALHFFYGMERNPVENTQKKMCSVFCYWVTSPLLSVSSFYSIAHITVLSFCAQRPEERIRTLNICSQLAYDPAPFTGTCSRSLKGFLLRCLEAISNTQLDPATCLSKGSIYVVQRLITHCDHIQSPKHIINPHPKQKCLPFLQIKKMFY